MNTRPVTVDEHGNEKLVDISGIADGDVLTYDAASGLWLPAAAGTGTVDAADVTYDNSGSGLTATDAQAAIDELEDEIDTISAGSIPAAKAWLSSNYHRDDYPASPTSMDDEFNDASGMSGATNGLNARWSWRNQGSTTATFTKAGWITLNCQSQGSNNLRIIEQTIPAGDGAWEAKIAYDGQFAGENFAGMALWDNTNGDGWTFGWLAQSNLGVGLKRWSNVTTGGSHDFGSDSGAPFVGRIGYFRAERAGSNWAFWLSYDGMGWLRRLVIADPIGANRIGLVTSETGSTGIHKTHADYFRKIA